MRFENNMKKGFTLFLSLVITGTLLLVATGIASIALKQAFLSTSGRESQVAFYAADTGLECALYWDVKNPTGFTAFAPSTTSTISCNQDDDNPGNQWTVGGESVSIFTINFEPDSSCAVVEVTKSGNTTVIESKGYNTCDSSNSRRVERGVKVSY